jgi:hypothetical protein
MKKPLIIDVTSITVVFILILQLFFNLMARDKMEGSLTKHRKGLADKQLYMIIALVITIDKQITIIQ